MKLTAELLKDIIQWDIEVWKNTLTVWQKFLPNNKNLKVLCIGEREGGLSLWFALQGFEVTCSDYKLKADKSLPLHKKYESGSLNINYKQLDVLNLDLQTDAYDIIAFKSVLGGLSTEANVIKAISELNRTLKPGGQIYFAENIKSSILHQVLRKRFTKWSSYWYYPSYSSLTNLFSSTFKKEEYCSFGFFNIFGKGPLKKIMLFFEKRIRMPQSLRYMALGVYRSQKALPERKAVS